MNIDDVWIGTICRGLDARVRMFMIRYQLGMFCGADAALRTVDGGSA